MIPTDRSSASRTFEKIAHWKEFLQKYNLPDSMPDYADKAYWEARYEMSHTQPQDWYIEPQQLTAFFTEFLNPKMEILELGSGSSKVIDTLWDLGYRKITGSDFSWKLINQRKEQEKNLGRAIKWELIDVTKEWPLKKNLNCIIEKGVLDCLPPSQMSMALGIIYDALPAGGLFVHISNARPEKRIKLSERWDVRIYELPKVNIPIFMEIDKNQVFYLYRCYK